MIGFASYDPGPTNAEPGRESDGRDEEVEGARDNDGRVGEVLRPLLHAAIPLLPYRLCADCARMTWRALNTGPTDTNGVAAFERGRG